MYKYILKRILLLIPIIIGVSILVFGLLDLAPGSVIDVIAEDYSVEEREALIHELGYDRSVFYRYAVYMENMLKGDMGTSLIYNADVLSLYLKSLPVTMILAVLSTLFAIVLSVPLGIVSATHHGSIIDNISMVLALLGLSMPNCWLGLMLMVYFSRELGWFPSGGVQDGIMSYVLPIITVGTGMMASLTRTTRSSMMDVINSDYLRTARAKGVPEKKVIRVHALKNALIPILTVIGVQIGTVIGGAVVTENVFSLPGVGRLIIDGVKQRDSTLVTGCVIMTTILICVIQLVIDLVYVFVDPRLRAQYSGGKKLFGKRKKAGELA